MKFFIVKFSKGNWKIENHSNLVYRKQIKKDKQFKLESENGLNVQLTAYFPGR